MMPQTMSDGIRQAGQTVVSWAGLGVAILGLAIPGFVFAGIMYQQVNSLWLRADADRSERENFRITVGEIGKSLASIDVNLTNVIDRSSGNEQRITSLEKQVNSLTVQTINDIRASAKDTVANTEQVLGKIQEDAQVREGRFNTQVERFDRLTDAIAELTVSQKMLAEQQKRGEATAQGIATRLDSFISYYQQELGRVRSRDDRQDRNGSQLELQPGSGIELPPWFQVPGSGGTG